MKAAVVTDFTKPLEIQDREIPEPGPGQVRLAVHAVGLNFLDVSLCRGDYPVRPDPPMTPGVEASRLEPSFCRSWPI